MGSSEGSGDGGRDSLAGLSKPRGCPGCGNRLRANDGASAYALRCDGVHHKGSRTLGDTCRYSCLDCCQFDFCLSCAAELPVSVCAQQVTVRLKADLKADPAAEETAGLGYVCRTLAARTVTSPAPHRDRTHRDCVPKERHEEVVARTAELEAQLRANRRLPDTPHARRTDPEATETPRTQPATPDLAAGRLQTLLESPHWVALMADRIQSQNSTC